MLVPAEIEVPLPLPEQDLARKGEQHHDVPRLNGLHPAVFVLVWEDEAEPGQRHSPSRTTRRRRGQGSMTMQFSSSKCSLDCCFIHCGRHTHEARGVNQDGILIYSTLVLW